MAGIKNLGQFAPVVVSYANGAAAGAQIDGYMFVSDGYYEVLEVRCNHQANGGSGAEVDVNIVPSGTAIGSGTSCLDAAFDLSTGAATQQVKSISRGTLAARASRLLDPGEALAADFGGTLTSLAGVAITVVLKRIRHAPHTR